MRLQLDLCARVALVGQGVYFFISVDFMWLCFEDFIVVTIIIDGGED